MNDQDVTPSMTRRLSINLEEELMNRSAHENLTGYMFGMDVTPCTFPSPPTCSQYSIMNEHQENENSLESLRKDEETKFIWASYSKTSRIDIVHDIVNSYRVIPRLPADRARSLLLVLFHGFSRKEETLASELMDASFKRQYSSNQLLKKKPRQEYSECQLLNEHFQMLLRVESISGSLVKPVQHSLGEIFIDLTECFHELVNTSGLSIPDEVKVHQRAILLVKSFIPLFHQVIQYRYPFLEDEKEGIQVCIEDAIFTHLQPTLHGIYAKQFQQQDQIISRALYDIHHNFSMKDIGIKPIFHLDGTSASYQLALDALHDFATLRSPSRRLSCLVKTCRSIDTSIKMFHNDSQDTRAKKENYQVYVLFQS